MNRLDREEPLPTDLAEAYTATWNAIADRILSYKALRTWKKRLAAAIHVSAVIAFLVGVGVPLFSDVISFQGFASFPGGPKALGYVSLAFGGLLLFVDQTFTVSTDYGRVRMTEMRLLALLYELELDWAAHQLEREDGTDQREHDRRSLELIRQARLGTHTIISNEVQEWIAGREKGIADLAGRVNSKTSAKP